MDGPTATPTCCTAAGGGGGVANLFSTIAGDISVDTVNSVISDLNLFSEWRQSADAHTRLDLQVFSHSWTGPAFAVSLRNARPPL